MDLPAAPITPPHTAPLTARIAQRIQDQIERGALPGGAKLPSIRQYAASQKVSIHTVVEAYDRLVASGWIHSRPHQGFYVRPRPGDAPAAAPRGRDTPADFDGMWYFSGVFEPRAMNQLPGCGWLPADWGLEQTLRRSLRHLSTDLPKLNGYGHPRGHPPLCQWLVDMHAGRELALKPDQVLLTHGASQGLDLCVRSLVRIGDAVLVDDPGYANLLFMLRLQGARLLGVPRTAQGYDLDRLEALCQQHRPKVFFTQPRLQNPTGSTASLGQLHRLLQIAHQHDLTLVENDIYADLDSAHRPSLASLDQLARVIHIHSFSKTITPNLRVGYVLAHPLQIRHLAALKMASGLTSSELSERLTLHVLLEGRWRKHLLRLRERLAQAHVHTAQWLTALGFELFAQPQAGLFLWARHPLIAHSQALAQAAARERILLGPGDLFQAQAQTDGAPPSPWLRFNVSFSLDAALPQFLSDHLSRRDPARAPAKKDPGPAGVT
ncbi:PLP-dependent aminotransferase family protein [Amphibiibacter pelophylacis]|uniref:PLP-dependent aminotransferase family protein n=1 Tax=Amphibiibacter pelophylacis TaxID=1799477 RepID=A0ACC6P402_9BURK